MKTIIFIILILLLMHSCQSTDNVDKESYFAGGTVLAEYRQVHEGSDSFTVTFYKKGTYKITFAQTPRPQDEECLYCDEEIIPKAFSVTVDQVPTSRVIYQRHLPNRLRVTITGNGEKETHDFR